MLDKIVKVSLQLLLAAFLLCVGFFSLLYFLKPHGEASSGISSIVPKNDCADNARNFLGSLKDGVDSAGYWKPGIEPRILYSVNDYRLLSNGKFVNFKLVFYNYEVNSSTQFGIPIRKRWDIVLDPNTNNTQGNKCAIVNLRDSEGHDPVVPESEMKTYLVPSAQPEYAPSLENNSTANTPEVSDTIRYDENKKTKQEIADRTILETSVCAHDMVESRLKVGIRSRKEITDQALQVCQRGLAIKSRVFGLGLTNEQIFLIVQSDIDREIKAAEEN